ncbi:MAG TPA: sulfatase, partial [Amaricoccus sp.]|nr:sulfatase [Amaricoccus sp.]
MPDLHRALGAALAVLVLHLLLVLPPAPGGLAPTALLRLSLELPVAILLLLAFPYRPTRALVTAFLAATTALKLADLATETAFRRPFNPVLDADLVAAAWRLTSGALGWPAALATAAALIAALALATLAAWWATGRIARLAPSRGRALLALAAALLALAPLPAPTARLALAHAEAARQAQSDLARFRAEAAADPYAARPPSAILPALAGADVLVVFVESYGRSALENPLYAPTVRAALADADARLAAAGLSARSGYLTAPMVGGQSWLAHASVLSGLAISDQGRYRALLSSPRRTLLHLARAAGWETAAVMPAITLAWPEG